MQGKKWELSKAIGPDEQRKRRDSNKEIKKGCLTGVENLLKISTKGRGTKKIDV